MSVLAAVLALAWPQEAQEEFEGSAAAWERIRSEEHPEYNRVAVEPDPVRARSGSRYLRMVTQGGNTAVELNPNAAWKVDPARAYCLSVFARLDGTRRNTASASLVWRDADRRPLGMPLRSSAVASPGVWRELRIEVPRVPPGASAVTVRLEFEGPDVRGEAGFDRVLLEPCVLLQIRPLNRELPVFDDGRSPGFEATAHGMSGEALLELGVRTAGGEEAARTQWPIASGMPTQVELAALKAGSYRLEASLRKDGLLVSRELPLLVANPAWMASTKAPWCGAYFDPSAVSYRGAGELARLARVRRAVVATDAIGSLEVLRSLAAASVRTVGVGPRQPGQAEFVDAWEPPGPRIPGGADGGDLLRRLVRLAASPGRPARVDVALDAPMFEPSGLPRDAFFALRAANDILTDAVARRDLQAPPIQAAFEKTGEMVLALWTEGPSAPFELPWGDRAELYDPRGGIRPIRDSERLTVTDFPIFVRRVPPGIVAAWLSLKLDAESIPLRRGPGSTTLRFRPPASRDDVSDLRCTIRPPKGWVVRPTESTLSWPDGPEASQEMSILLPAEEPPGTREVGVEVSYLERGTRRTVRKPLPVLVTSLIEISGTVADAPGGRKVTVRIANRASREAALVARIRIPSRPEHLEFLGKLPAGGSARPLEFLVNDPAAEGDVEVFVEERTGERLFAREKLSLR